MTCSTSSSVSGRGMSTGGATCGPCVRAARRGAPATTATWRCLESDVVKVPVAQDILDGYAAEAAGAHRIEPRCRVRRQRLVQRGEQRPALGAEAGGAGEEVLG